MDEQEAWAILEENRNKPVTPQMIEASGGFAGNILWQAPMSAPAARPATLVAESYDDVIERLGKVR